MKLADQRGQQMRVLGMIIVPDPVKVSRHYTDKVRSVLSPACLAKFDASNFSNSVSIISWFQFTGQQIFLLNRLWGKFWINTGTAKKEQFFDAPIRRGMN